MKTIRDLDIKNKRILVRCDFNVPLNKKGEILNDFRIRAGLPTIKYLIENKATVILISHLGNPQTQSPLFERKVGTASWLSLKPIAKKLERFLKQKVKFLPDCIGKEIKKEIKKMKSSEVILLENLRFHEGEKENNEQFVRQLASLSDIYINNAFGVCHRKHASVIGIPKILPSGAGFLLEKEINILSRSLEEPERPLTAVIGGAKIETKTKAIDAFLKKADYLLIGGKIAYDPKLQCASAKRSHIEKLLLPEDNIKNFDIGPKAIKEFVKIIKKSRTIIWNGPIGMFEDKRFEKGTKKIAKAIAENKIAFKVAGGGETIEAIYKYGLEKKFNHISTGGGAMLAFLSGEKLPGIEALK